MNNDLIVKDVQFENAVLKAAQNVNNNKVYVGVKWVCEGIGLTPDQIKNERKKIQSDLVLKQGGSNLTLPTNSGNQDVLCLDIEFLPLWLAKISITPKMKQNSPQVVEKLINYQLKAKDVLARAFIYGEFDLPKDYKSALGQLMLTVEKNDKLQKQNNHLETRIQDLEPKAQAYIDMMTAQGYLQFIDVAGMVEIGRNTLMQFLRKHKVLTKQSNFNIPYNRFRKNGYFKVICGKTEQGHVTSVTMVSPKGLDYIYKLIHKYNAENDFDTSKLLLQEVSA